mmetsp:Transcript_19082/g.30490  ORF Transcript_19082/g.30490 Transcript_19082/m.30490 type:complete len:262 (+) Transcript_19082:218-1003(+)
MTTRPTTAKTATTATATTRATSHKLPLMSSHGQRKLRLGSEAVCPRLLLGSLLLRLKSRRGRSLCSLLCSLLFAAEALSALPLLGVAAVACRSGGGRSDCGAEALRALLDLLLLFRRRLCRSWGRRSCFSAEARLSLGLPCLVLATVCGGRRPLHGQGLGAEALGAIGLLGVLCHCYCYWNAESRCPGIFLVAFITRSCGRGGCSKSLGTLGNLVLRRLLRAVGLNHLLFLFGLNGDCNCNDFLLGDHCCCAVRRSSKKRR